MVCLVNSVTLSGKSGASSGKAEDEGVAGATSRTRTPPGVSSGWRNPWLSRGSADRYLGLAAPQASHDCVVVVGQALQPASPSPPCPTRLDERLPDPTCLFAEPLTRQSTKHRVPLNS
ncbi:MAG: hypothetical protein M1280_03090 [Actinobacteria bacterium]|nr:hypothetical protein [Actinomycetota bacterium]